MTVVYKERIIPGPIFFKKSLFIYLTEREHKQGEQQAEEGEAGSQLSREPDAGFDPRTLGS